MGDDDLAGISRDGEPLRSDDAIEGVRQGQVLIKGGQQPIVEGIERSPEDLQDILLPDQPSGGSGGGGSSLTQLLVQLFRQRAQLEQDRIRPVSDSTTSAGSGTAAVIEKGARRNQFEVFYDLDSGADDIVIEVSLDGSSWKPYASLSVPAGGDRDVATGQTVFTNVRVYPGNSFDDTDVNLIQVVSAGDG